MFVMAETRLLLVHLSFVDFSFGVHAFLNYGRLRLGQTTFPYITRFNLNHDSSSPE